MLDKAVKPPFSQGQHVYYPGVGLATIVAVEEMEVAGFATTVYDLLYSKDGSHVKVPIAKAAKNGLRHVGTRQQLDAAIGVIKEKPRSNKQLWQLWAQKLEQKLHSNDMLVVAEVIRDLYVSEHTEGRSDTERRLYEQAFRLFLPEAALILGKTEQGALMYIAEQTGKTFKPNLGTGVRDNVGSRPAQYKTPATPRATAPKPLRAVTPVAPRPDAPPPHAVTPAAPRLAAQPSPVRTAPVPTPPREPARPVAPPRLVVVNPPDAHSIAPVGNGKDEHAQALATVDELRRQLLAVRGEAEKVRKQMESERSSHRTATEALQTHLTARTLEAKALEAQLSEASRELRNAQEQLHGARGQLEAQAFGIADLETVHRNEIGRLQELLLWACVAFFASEAERSRMTHAATTEEVPVAAKPRPKKRSGLKRQPGGFLWNPKWDAEIGRKKNR